MEDFVNYKVPSMFIISAMCDWKCCTEQNISKSICQNYALAQSDLQFIPDETIYNAYHQNDITKAVVIGGLEPMLQTDELYELICLFRARGEECPFVIYTGYYPDEIADNLLFLKPLGNIIVKFGRFIFGGKPRYDEVLGVTLASDNQFAERIC